MQTMAVHPDQATCVAGALTLATARRQRVLENPLPFGTPASYANDPSYVRQYVLTEASDVTTHKNKQGHSVWLQNWHSVNYKQDPAGDVRKALTVVYSASCWPVGVTPQ